MNDCDKNALAILAAELWEAKKREGAATKLRIAIENEIAALAPGPEKGQVTVTLKDGAKVVVKRALNYKADLAAIEEVFLEVLEPLLPPLKMSTTTDLDVAGYEWYRKNHPEVFELFKAHVVVTPKKTSVILKAPKV